MIRWHDLTPRERELAVSGILTDRELAAIQMTAPTLGTRRIADALSISRGTLRDRLHSARRKIAAAIEQETT